MLILRIVHRMLFRVVGKEILETLVDKIEDDWSYKVTFEVSQQSMKYSKDG